MSGGILPRTMPLRRWLIIALVMSIVIPLGIALTIAFHFSGMFPGERLQEAGERIIGQTAQWSDPAWQQATTASLAEHGIDFVLVANGQELYRTIPDPEQGDSDEGRILRVDTVDVAGVSYTARLYIDSLSGPPEQIRNYQVPFVALATLFGTLAGIAWFLGRMVIRPLDATSEAARQVAAGNLDINLPASRVSEVNRVNAAFNEMSADLRASLEHEASVEQERRFFIGAVAHDLRTPLFTLRGSLEAITSGVADTPEKRSRYIAVAQEKADALEHLITDLFDYTRLEYLDQTPTRESFDLAGLLERLVESHQPHAETKGLALVFEHPPGPCMVEADRHLLIRAVENLIDNALRFTPSGGQIRVTCAGEGSEVRFSVADTGPGIPLAELPKLFAPLYRGETSRNRRTGGAGLGLTIARRILLAHGGDLTARNAPTGGAIFEARLTRAG
jgi:signal transduction histidine kinase